LCFSEGRPGRSCRGWFCAPWPSLDLLGASTGSGSDRRAGWCYRWPRLLTERATSGRRTATGLLPAIAGGPRELRGRAGDRLDAVVQRIVVDARNPNRMLLAAWFRNSPSGGVFESADGAKTWKLAGLGSEAVRALEQSASDAAVWIAGTRSGV